MIALSQGYSSAPLTGLYLFSLTYALLSDDCLSLSTRISLPLLRARLQSTQRFILERHSRYSAADSDVFTGKDSTQRTRLGNQSCTKTLNQSKTLCLASKALEQSVVQDVQGCLQSVLLQEEGLNPADNHGLNEHRLELESLQGGGVCKPEQSLDVFNELVKLVLSSVGEFHFLQELGEDDIGVFLYVLRRAHELSQSVYLRAFSDLLLKRSQDQSCQLVHPLHVLGLQSESQQDRPKTWLQLFALFQGQSSVNVSLDIELLLVESGYWRGSLRERTQRPSLVDLDGLGKALHPFFSKCKIFSLFMYGQNFGLDSEVGGEDVEQSLPEVNPEPGLGEMQVETVGVEEVQLLVRVCDGSLKELIVHLIIKLQ